MKSGMADRVSFRRVWSHLVAPYASFIGVFALSPSGIPLAKPITTPGPDGPEVLRPMLAKALARYKELSQEERLLPVADEDLPTSTWPWDKVIGRQDVPGDVLPLRVYSRDLPREEPVDPEKGFYFQEWAQGGWNTDFLWLDRARELIPSEPEVGKSYSVPEWFARRLAKYHLVDNVRGKTKPYEDDDIKELELEAKVTAIDGDRIDLLLTGNSLTIAHGLWALSEVSTPVEAERGFDSQLYGWVRYDRGAKKFLQFDMVAIGIRWGSTASNRRYDDEFAPITDDTDPNPMGIAFTLAEESLEQTIPPSFLWDLPPEDYFD